MSRKISVLLVCVLFFLLASCREKHNLELRGEVSNIETPYILAAYSIADTLKIDTIEVKKGKFSYTNTIDTLTSFTLYFNDLASSSVFFADKNQKLTLTGDAKLPDLIEVFGNEINDELTSFKQRNTDLLTQRGKLLNSMDENNSLNGSTLTGNEKIAQINALNHELTQQAEEFIKENPTKLSSLVLINDFFFNNENPKALERVLGYLQGDAANSTMAGIFKAYLAKINLSAEGANTPYFKLIDKKKKTIEQSNYTGKYLLLSFVSSTGEESRENIKTLRNIYPKLNKDSVAFVSIYIDTDTYPVSDVKTDSIPWTVVSEKKSWASEIVDAFNIKFVPYNILISPQGIIKDRNISSQEVLKTIKNTPNSKS